MKHKTTLSDLFKNKKMIQMNNNSSETNEEFEKVKYA